METRIVHVSKPVLQHEAFEWLTLPSRCMHEWCLQQHEGQPSGPQLNHLCAVRTHLAGHTQRLVGGAAPGHLGVGGGVSEPGLQCQGARVCGTGALLAGGLQQQVRVVQAMEEVTL